MTEGSPIGSAPGSGAALAAVWVGTFQLLANRIGHDLRNALNAVAVNLEVVRGRSARGADVATIAPFAATAAAQYETASAAAEALLGFARPEPGDPDVAAVVAQLGRLVGVRSVTALKHTDSTRGAARATVPADLVRAVVARSVLTGLDVSDSVACETAVDGDIFLRVTVASQFPPSDPELIAVASAHGVQFASRDNVLEVRFPAGARANPTDPA